MLQLIEMERADEADGWYSQEGKEKTEEMKEWFIQLDKALEASLVDQDEQEGDEETEEWCDQLVEADLDYHFLEDWAL